MKITAIIWLLLNLVTSMVKWAEARKAIEADEAKRMAKTLKESIDVLQRVENARREAERRFDESGGMPDDTDPNLRD